MARVGSIHVLLLLALGTVPLAPAAHAHEVAEDDGHHVFIHRHAGGHHGSQVPASHEHDGGVDHDDAPLLTATTIFTVPTSHSIQGAPAVLVARYLAPALLGPSPRTSPHAQVPIHGPPRASLTLRGPPVSPAL